MPVFALILASFAGYGLGLVLLWKITPRLRSYQVDELAFIGAAMLDVLAGILLFSAVAIPPTILAASTIEAIEGRVLALLFLLGIVLVAGSTALRSFFWSPGSLVLSRVLAGGYCLLLTVAALFALVWIFLPSH
jgi:hypothetical protein